MTFIARLMGWEAADRFAESMASQFANHVSIASCTHARSVDRAFLSVLAQTKGEIRKNNWRGSVVARLAHTFGWKLTAMGYPKDLSLSLAQKLAIELARDKKPAG